MWSNDSNFSLVSDSFFLIILSWLAFSNFSKSSLSNVNNGIAVNSVISKDGFEPIFKDVNNSPACLKPATAKKLTQRGVGHGLISSIIPFVGW